MKNLVFLLFVIWCVPLTAQNLFAPGYIVTAEGKTIPGLIYEKADAEMSRWLIFKTSEDSENQKYNVKTLSAFGFDSGREFERRLLLPKPGNEGDTTYIFAKKLLRGNIDVFAARHFQKRKPDLFFDNNSRSASIQIYRSGNEEAISVDEFLEIFINEPNTLPNPLAVKFREKWLLRSIAAHNKTLNRQFPDSVYKENIEHNWDIIAGLPVDYSRDAVHFRAAIYFNRTNSERTPNFSYLSGLIYHHWERKDISVLGTHQYEEMNTKWQMINLMPLGIRFQGNSGNFIPYGYIGAGVALIRETDVFLEGIADQPDQISREFQPTINSGLGIKTKIGRNFLITELTPTTNNLFLNFGWSI